MQLEKSRTARVFSAPKRVFAVTLAAGVVCLAGVASAQPEYAGELKDAIDMPCVPACTLCHTRPEGGNEFLNSFAGVGLGAKDIPMFPLTGDADGDSVSDGDELKKGTNPAVYGDYSVCAPEYGCGARIAPVPADGGLKAEWALGALGLGVVLRWQLRRRAAKRPPAA